MTAAHIGDVAPRQMRLWRQVAVPSEHGGWSLTAEPVVLGLVVAWSWPGPGMSVNEGGDPPCWAHLFDNEPGWTGGAERVVVVDVGATDTRGRSVVVWSLPHRGDLDAHLDPGGATGAHVNDKVDVLVSVIAGRGRLAVNSEPFELHGDVLAALPKGSRREVRAGGKGITCLSIHRRRGPLAIGTKPGDSTR